jgi:hypothetical protein
MSRPASLPWCSILLLTAFCLSPLSAHAVGINLAWNDCPRGPTAGYNRGFACNTNTGSQLLVVSFEPPPSGLTGVTGMNAIIDVYSEACPVPDWWQFKYALTCRQNSMSVSASFEPGQTGCADPWQTLGAGSLAAYLTRALVPSLPQNMGRILTSVTVSEPMGVTMPAGPEYYACNAVITNERTVGPSACPGCSFGACIILEELLLTTLDSGDVRISNPLDSNFVTWQGGMFGCPYTEGGGPACTVPVQNHTWGQIKTLYR